MSSMQALKSSDKRVMVWAPTGLEQSYAVLLENYYPLEKLFSNILASGTFTLLKFTEKPKELLLMWMYLLILH